MVRINLILFDVSSMYDIYICVPLGPTIQHVIDVFEKSGFINSLLMNTLTYWISVNIISILTTISTRFKTAYRWGSFWLYWWPSKWMFMNAFEERIFKSHHTTIANIQHWFRYVDILGLYCTWAYIYNGPEVLLQNFLSVSTHYIRS